MESKNLPDAIPAIHSSVLSDGHPAVPAFTTEADLFRDLVDGAVRGNAIVRGRRCIYCNHAFAQIFGMSGPPEALAMPDLFELVSPQDKDHMLDDARRFAKGDPTVPIYHQFRARRHDGTEIWVEVDARNIIWQGLPALHVAGRDITAIKLMEKNRDLLASAFDQAQEALYMTDAHGTILFANLALSTLTGYSEHELLGANPRIFKSGKHDQFYYAEMWKELTVGRMWAGRVINRRKDGRLIELDSRISPVRNAKGDITNYIGVQYDITQQVALEARLRQAEKMETLGQLAGGIAHDFNNLLQVIAGWNHLVMEDREITALQKSNLKRVDEAVQRAAGLTRQLLTMGRKTVPRPRSVDMNEIVDGQLKLLGRLIGEQIELKFVRSNDPAIVMADPAMVEQVVMNLCINARDAMPEGGKLVVEVQPSRLDKDFCRSHAWAKAGAYIRLSVSDSGVGMSPEVCGRIFEPFFTTKEPGKGTGLGLSTVMSIVQQHHALINVYSEPGIGSTFHVYFAASDAGVSANLERPPKSVRGGRGERVLLAEDDPAVGEFLCETLERGGYQVTHAVNGQQAVDEFITTQTPFDLVVLDLVMPKLSGRHVYDLMHSLRPETRFLFNSGYSPHIADVGFIANQKMTLLQKPYSPSVL
ncbi:MAG TPA: PAS domain S-box protein, partial [bacterium]